VAGGSTPPLEPAADEEEEEQVVVIIDEKALPEPDADTAGVAADMAAAVAAAAAGDTDPAVAGEMAAGAVAAEEDQARAGSVLNVTDLTLAEQVMDTVKNRRQSIQVVETESGLQVLEIQEPFAPEEASPDDAPDQEGPGEGQEAVPGEPPAGGDAMPDAGAANAAGGVGGGAATAAEDVVQVITSPEEESVMESPPVAAVQPAKEQPTAPKPATAVASPPQYRRASTGKKPPPKKKKPQGWLVTNPRLRQFSLDVAHRTPRLPRPVKKWRDADFGVDMPGLLVELSTHGEKIGSGNFGSVSTTMYQGKRVAVKVQAIPDIYGEEEWAGEILDNLVSELSLMRACENHPFCVQFLGAGRVDNEVFFVMGLAEMGDLRGVLEEEDCPGYPQLVRIVRDSVAGLAHLHELKMMHRDFKTPNVLVTADLRGKLCDFGFTISGECEARLATCAGTEEFMAPEMENGDDFALPADVFSVGITMCEVATKRRPGSKRFLYRSPRRMYAFEPEAKSVYNNLCRGCPKRLVQIAEACCRFVDTERLLATEAVDEMNKLCADMGIQV